MPKKTADGMGVGVFQVLVDRPSGDPAVIAKRAEELGFDSYWVPDHTVIPKGSADDYPAKASDDPPPAYMFKLPDPLIALSRASATTSTIRLGTGILLVPERNPLHMAKEIASLDHYSNGRFVFGIGAGWNEPECTVMGGDFAHRWTQTKESIHAMKALWMEEESEYHGKYYDFDALACFPKPTRKPHPPILLGSLGSPRVYKRVAEWGDGWLPFCADPQDLADGKAEIAKYALQVDRDPASLEIALFAPDGMFRTAAELREMARAGADTAVLWLRGQDEKELLAELDELAAAVF